MAFQLPKVSGNSARGNGQVSFSLARAAKLRSRQARTPPEMPNSRQDTIVHVQGDVALDAAGRLISRVRSSARGLAPFGFSIRMLPIRHRSPGKKEGIGGVIRMQEK